MNSMTFFTAALASLVSTGEVGESLQDPQRRGIHDIADRFRGDFGCRQAAVAINSNQTMLSDED